MENNLKQAQVFTPDWATSEMIDMLEDSILINDEYFFFEPSCGDGQMLVVILERIFNAMLSKYKNDKEKSLADTLHRFYAIELDPELVPKARMRIFDWSKSKLSRSLNEFEQYMIARSLQETIENKNFFDVMNSSSISGSHKAKKIKNYKRRNNSSSRTTSEG